MDNLQTHYLGRLEVALEQALHGDIDSCLNACVSKSNMMNASTEEAAYIRRLYSASWPSTDRSQFELRLKPDLALWTRAAVNLILAWVTDVQRNPDKSKFAREALRIVQELQDEDNPSKDAFWNTE